MRTIYSLISTLVTAVLISSACSGHTTPTEESSSEQEGSQGPVTLYTLMEPSPTAVKDIVVSDDGEALKCRDGLVAVNLLRDNSDKTLKTRFEIGETMVVAESHSTDEVIHRNIQFPDETIPNITAAFVTIWRDGGITQLKPPTPIPGSIRKESYSHEYYTVVWKGGMERGFSVDAREFGNGYGSLDQITLCANL